LKIIYPTSTGVAVVHPTGELPIEETARKDVPAGVPYMIVDDSVLPSDRTFRDAWEADFSAPHGNGIGALRWFIEQVDKNIAAMPDVENSEEVRALAPIANKKQFAKARAVAVKKWKQSINELLVPLQAERARLVAELVRTEGVSE
jgi:hypothetical protein